MSVSDVLQKFLTDRIVSRIWQRDTTVFASPTAPADLHSSITNRLGWLEAPEGSRRHAPHVLQLSRDLERDGMTDVYVLGMGGSSLCAEVLREVAGKTGGGRSLAVLDTTDERAVHEVTASLDPSRALFVVASKSGSTIEVSSLERHFWSVMTAAVGQQAGAHFVAITDPDTSLVAHAAARGYRHTFINPPDIGGRFSALSLFGLVPGALCGVELNTLIDSATAMANQCRIDEADNPGLALGVFMGVHALGGRDKLTTIIPRVLAPLGVWIEQLVAESTGKHERGVLPVVDEPLGEPSEYGQDRAFVAVLTPGAELERRTADRLGAAGHPVLIIETNPGQLGAEFFRWEFATAVAGAVLGVNPFDEPNVRSAKERTQSQLQAYAATGALRMDPPLTGNSVVLERTVTPAQASATEAGRYVAILDYLPLDSGRGAAIAQIRGDLRRRTGHATTHGIGPRYLHSTGQYHKGGPNTGIFVLLTAADRTTTEIPESGYSFSTLKQAQALGDFDALAAAGRTVMHFHVTDPEADFAAMLDELTSRVG